jgi:hypothetical protein
MHDRERQRPADESAGACPTKAYRSVRTKNKAFGPPAGEAGSSREVECDHPTYVSIIEDDHIQLWPKRSLAVTGGRQ